MATIRFKDVKKNYKKKELTIKGVNLDIKEGEFVVIVGPSGCGKSTLLRMLAGLEQISDGDIFINEKRVNHIEPADRNIAMVFQNYALYPHMTVYENMAYGLKNRKIPKKEIRQRVKDVAEMLEISEYLERKPSELSGGQRQRVSMGRAIIRKPDVFLFDEPLSNLDARLRVHMRLEIRRLQKRLGITTIYVTHDQVEAMTLADRLVVFRNGQIEQSGKPMEIYHDPATTFVGKFIGSPAMEFLQATLEEDCRHVVLGNGEKLRIGNLTGVVSPGKLLRLGVRPEHWSLCKNTNNEGLHICVDLVETLGADTLLYGTLNGTSDRVSLKVPGQTEHVEGSRLAINIHAEDISIFDPETKCRIHRVRD